MTTRFTALGAGVLAKLGLAPPTPAANAEAPPTPAAGEPAASDDTDEDDQTMPAKGKKKPMPAGEDAADADAAADDEAVAAALAETATAAASAATKAANARWQAVLASAEAEGRVALAANLLGSTSMTADEVKAALALAPKAGAGTKLSDRMAEIPNPAVTADGAAAETDPRAGNHGWDKTIEKVFGSVRK